MSRIVDAPPAQAHTEEECAVCPEPPACPPEGFMLVAVDEDPTDAQQTIEEAIEAIEAAQEAAKK
jgi:hypothetical protein